MIHARPLVFWIGVLAAVIAAVVVLHEVLLPFVAGMVLAYLLNPLAVRIERLGVSRSLATLVIMIFAVGLFVFLLFLALPVIVRELAYFIESLPLYTRRLHALVTDSNWPWARKIIGDGLDEAERLVGRASPGHHAVSGDRDADRCVLPALLLEANDYGT